MESKVSCITVSAVILAVALGITSVILNIVILTKSNSINSNTNAIQSALKPAPATTVAPVNPSASTTTAPNNLPQCGNFGLTSNSTGYSDASAYLLSGLDESIDPCEDFYAFTCNKYLASIDLNALHQSRKGTYDDAQVKVNQFIAQQIDNINMNDPKVSLTEKITKRSLEACVAGFTSVDNELAGISDEINSLFGGAPFTGGNLTDAIDLFNIAGYLEQQHALGTIMSSWVTVDYKNIGSNGLYISQPSLDMPRDYFVLPQFIDQLQSEQDTIFSVMQDYNKAVGGTATDAQMTDAARAVVDFEVLIAMASWPDDLLRNYRQQYNSYTLDQLKTSYPNIGFDSYLNQLVSNVLPKDSLKQVILSQPSYFSWLNSIICNSCASGTSVSQDTVANYMIVQFLMDSGSFWDNSMSRTLRKTKFVPYAMRRGRGLTRIGRRYVPRFAIDTDDTDSVKTACLDIIMAYMPYGPGYVYVKNLGNKKNVLNDISDQTTRIIKSFQQMMGTLTWMTPATYTLALNKSDSLVKNYGYPVELFGDFSDHTTIDKYHMDYKSILDMNATDVYNIMKVHKRGLEVREAFRLLNPTDEAVWGSGRANFLQSPAMVNAWYQPERNSITFPFAIWNPPYYDYTYPQAYNYAGQGGTGGHELTHGFDDEGVQFDWDGSMTECDGKYKCGWMDTASNDGFTDMAQCVVSQYSSQCCPLKTGNVHCANGATTQGENIADLGGQQAAYNAYQQYIQDHGQELRLPGMAQYSPNQVFWITYGFSWCMKQTDDNLRNQLLTNPHAPAQCRTNQVMQDIPQFGRDFNCKQGSAMYPTSDQRCKVWTGI